MAALYFHIPFCRRICGYCDFFRSANTAKMDLVVEAMVGELREECNFLSSKELRTIYFGGGTPSLLSPQQVGDFLKEVATLYSIGAVEEITLEANPDDLTLDYLRAIREVGVNRLSIGVQSFDDEELKFMNRRHTAQEVREVVANARSVGFDNIAIDLIFGVRGFDAEVLRRSVREAIVLDVEHIAAYHLTIELKTIFGRMVERGEFAAVDESTSEAEYELLHEELTRAGYEHYEVSNYAKVGFRSRHNSSYWQGGEYLGIGAGAHSFDGKSLRRWAVESVERYLSGGVDRYESEVLTLEDRRNEVVMTSLRCAEGIDLTAFAEKFGVERKKELLKSSERWIESGDLVAEDGRLRIPCERMLRSDLVIESLFAL
ncbi:MAG: radical SAM family heme chaperone HemW [Rikenellaceae bacterium]